MTQFDPKALRQAFSVFPTGVTIVTARADDGTPVGFTANSFTSVSLDPPLLLVCPGRYLSSFPVFETCSRFAVNVLADGQEALSDTFARFGGDRFAQAAWTDDPDLPPVFHGVAAHFLCTTHQIIPAGDHVVLMGEVEAFERSERLGLGFAEQNYFSLGSVNAAERERHYG
ncbi:flavin reductase family protein [Nisaea sp.]|uniref:flavin reductase family protein n=1 Tax=Nisaea sp. TaxID=2024842 RepID=UPI003297D7D3